MLCGALTGLTMVPAVAKTRSALVTSLLCGITESASKEHTVTIAKSVQQRHQPYSA
jgi:hypothetical protein